MLFSLEISPFREPTKDSIAKYQHMLKEFTSMKPEFISVTSRKDTVTKALAIASYIQDTYQTKAVVHVTCEGLTKEKADKIISYLKEFNIYGVLIVRGDNVDLRDFQHSSQLIAYIRKQLPDIKIFSSCYPEFYSEPYLDLFTLKEKDKHNIESFVSQITFNNAFIYNLRMLMAMNKIETPILPGIICCSSLNQYLRLTTNSNIHLDSFLYRILMCEDKEATKHDAIQYAINQIKGLSPSYPRIHLYTMNNVDITKSIINNII